MATLTHRTADAKVSMGYPAMPVDLSHHDLVAFVNDIEIALEAGLESDALCRAVDELLDRIGQDLAAEERLMWSTGYPGRDAHREAHQQLAFGLAEAVAVCLGETHASLDRLLECVHAWLSEHGGTMDAALAAHALSRR